VRPELAGYFRRAASGMMGEAKLSAIADCLVDFPWQHEDEIVVEIGAYHGTTTVMMAQVLNTAFALGWIQHNPTILSIDAFDRCVPEVGLNPKGSYAECIASILKHGYGCQCLVLSAFSQDAAPLVPPNIGVLIVDGWHHYETSKSDLVAYGEKVVPGGFVMVDDCEKGSYPGVVQALDEFLAEHSTTFRVMHRSYFAVLQRVF
jgi:hypothetical protein